MIRHWGCFGEELNDVCRLPLVVGEAPECVQRAGGAVLRGVDLGPSQDAGRLSHLMATECHRRTAPAVGRRAASIHVPPAALRSAVACGLGVAKGIGAGYAPRGTCTTPPSGGMTPDGCAPSRRCCPPPPTGNRTGSATCGCASVHCRTTRRQRGTMRRRRRCIGLRSRVPPPVHLHGDLCACVAGDCPSIRAGAAVPDPFGLAGAGDEG